MEFFLRSYSIHFTWFPLQLASAAIRLIRHLTIKGITVTDKFRWRLWFRKKQMTGEFKKIFVFFTKFLLNLQLCSSWERKIKKNWINKLWRRKKVKKLSMQWRRWRECRPGRSTPNLDPVLHQLQPPGARVQRLRQLPHLLLLRKRLQADPPQVCEGAPLTKIFHGLNGRS